MGQVRFQSLVGCSPFTIHRLLSPPTSAFARLHDPPGFPLQEYLLPGGQPLPSVYRLCSGTPQGCNLCHPKRTGTRSGKNCFSFGIDIFYRGHRGHAVNKCHKLLSLLINFVPITSRGQKLSTGDTGDKIALSTGINPNKCRRLA